MTNEEAIKIMEALKSPLDALKGTALIEGIDTAISALKAQEPLPVESSIDRTWGIRKRVPVCPRCESFLTIMHFIGDGKKISYCEHCGQAVNWEDWEYDE